MPSDSFEQEPRQVFVNRLIYITSQLYQQIYVDRASVVKVLPAIIGVIAILNTKNKLALKEIIFKLQKCRKTSNYPREDIEQIFSDIMDYLHNTHVKELSWIKPRFDSPIIDYEKETDDEAENQNK